MTNLARPTFYELIATSAKIGCLSFGGPAVQIAIMYRIFIEEKKWIDEARYMHALNYCMLLPGPEAQQLATYVGWLLHGVKGGLVAGLLFILPGALVVFGLSWLYAAHGSTLLVEAGFYGIRAAVLALVVEAFLRISKRALKAKDDPLIALASFIALSFFGAPFPVVILLAGIYGAWRARNAPRTDARLAPISRAALQSLPRQIVIWGGVWVAPLLTAIAVLGLDHTLVRVGIFFSKLAVVTFGGAYAVLTWLRTQAIDVECWLNAAQMIDGLGLAETTPGPLVLVNQFVGFMAGYQAPQGGLALGVLAAAMASWTTFAPSFLWIFGGAPFAESLRRNPRAAGALAATTSAVLGVIANLAFWFATHVLFSRSVEVELPTGAIISLPEISTLDLSAASITLAATIALTRLHSGAITVISASLLAGIILKLVA